MDFAEKKLAAIAKEISDLVRGRRDFEVSLKAPRLERPSQADRILKEAIESRFKAAINVEDFLPDRLTWLFPQRKKRLFLLEKRSLFDAVIERDYERIREILKSDFDERPYFFQLKREGQRVRAIGFNVRAGLFSFNRALIDNDKQIIELFLELKESEAVESICLDGLSSLLLSLHLETREKGRDSVVESLRFQTLTLLSEPERLKSVFEKGQIDQSLLSKDIPALYFARVVLERQFPEEWASLVEPFADSSLDLKEDIDFFGRVCKDVTSRLTIKGLKRKPKKPKSL